MLDSIDSENARDCYRASLTYYLGMLPAIAADSRFRAADGAVGALQALLGTHGFLDPSTGASHEVTGAEADAYYAEYGRPGDANWVAMMNEGNNAFDKLDAEYVPAA